MPLHHPLPHDGAFGLRDVLHGRLHEDEDENVVPVVDPGADVERALAEHRCAVGRRQQPAHLARVGGGDLQQIED